MKNAVGIDIGGSHVQCSIVDLNTGYILKDCTTDVVIDKEASADQLLQNWAHAINQSIDKSPVKVLGLGFAMPGPFNYKEGIAMYDGVNDKFKHLYGLKIEDLLRPMVNVEADASFRYHNDATCFAIGEAVFGQAQGVERSIALTLGTGFGSAFIDQTVPIVHREDVPEDGCLWHLPYKDGIADDYLSTRWIVNECEKRTGIRANGVKELAEMHAESRVIRDVFDEYGFTMGSFLAPWIKKFQAEVVVVGGNISRAFPLYAAAIFDGLAQYGVSCPFRVSELRELAAILGSAKLVDQAFFDLCKDKLPTK